MTKPMNHHFSGHVSSTPFGKPTKKWYCTLVYNETTKYVGIAVVGKKDQFCRKTGARIAFGRATLSTEGRYSYKVKDEAELKDIMGAFRHTTYLDHLHDLIRHYFPTFQLRKSGPVQSELRRAVG
jgi:hypothetical protein